MTATTARQAILCWCCHLNMSIVELLYMYIIVSERQAGYRSFQNTGLTENVSIKVLACGTGISFSRFSGEWRQA